MDFGSTTYVILIRQFYKWFKMWHEAPFKLVVSRRQQGKMASNQSLLVESSLSNILFQKSNLESITDLNPFMPKFGTCA